MTANHLLIYRLAELMLEKQQHVLAVDDLFEDEQIGEFVKSIQIDSPYQQMLLEGVLTESVKENKLFVTFTVEGYFHYALGEVIYNQAAGKGHEFLKNIIENNQLNGSNEGVEQCLIRDVENDDLSRLIWLIDQGGNVIDVCSVPLAHAFLQLKGNPKTDEEIDKSSKEQIKRVMDELLADPTDNDISVLEKAIQKLNRVQYLQKLDTIYKEINDLIIPNNLKNARLFLSSLRHITSSELINKLRYLDSFNIKSKPNASYAHFLSRLGVIYIKKDVANYKRAIELFDNALKINLKRYPKSHISVAVNYSEIGIAYMQSEVWGKANDNFQLALKIKAENNNRDFTAEYDLLGTLEFKQKNYYNALKYFIKSLKLKEFTVGKYHSEYSSSLSAVALTYSALSDNENAIKYYKLTLNIDSKLILHDKERIAVLNKKIGDLEFGLKKYASALKHLMVFWNYLKGENKLNLKQSTLANKITKCINLIGLEKYKIHKYEAAILTFQSAIDIMDQLNSIKYKIDHSIYFNLGNAYYKNAQLEDAKYYYLKSLKIKSNLDNIESDSIGRLHNSIGNLEMTLKNYPLAKKHFVEAHFVFQNYHGPDHPHTKLLAHKLKELNDR